MKMIFLYQFYAWQKYTYFIERHITLDKKSKGLDHSSSSEINELKRFQSYNSNF